jgi:L-asparaginase
VLEETAFALELLLRVDVPVALTGAMRLANQPSADGDANLIAAVRVAASAEARGKGVLVVFDDEIHWAPLAKKRHAFRTHAFSSDPFGPMGWIVEGRVRFFLKPEKRLPLLKWGGRQTVIPILEVGPGLEAEFIERLPNADALVLSLPGGGHVAESAVPLLSALPMPVIFASRTGAGETLRTSYGYPGGEIDLLARGLIAAGPLDARRARMAAAILLSGGATRGKIAEFFASL